MSEKQCYHCHQWIDQAQQKTHDCWTTTPEKLIEPLSEDLRDAWERVRETALSFGEQRSYASHKSIMFSRKACYCFVRPKRDRLELCFFLGRALKTPRVKKIARVSKRKFSHLVHVVHRDEVESPLTDWLQEAYEVSQKLSLRPAPRKKAVSAKRRATPKRKKKARLKKASRKPSRAKAD